VLRGGVYRLKHHLAESLKDVEPCRAVSDDVQKDMLKIVISLQQALIKRNNKKYGVEIDEEGEE
jgi:hypothetical protein